LIRAVNTKLEFFAAGKGALGERDARQSALRGRAVERQAVGAKPCFFCSFSRSIPIFTMS